MLCEFNFSSHLHYLFLFVIVYCAELAFCYDDTSITILLLAVRVTAHGVLYKVGTIANIPRPVLLETSFSYTISGDIQNRQL